MDPMIDVIPQPLIPAQAAEPLHVDDNADLEDIILRVDGLKATCLEEKDKGSEMRWLLLAAGIALIAAGIFCIGMAFATQNGEWGKIGLGLIVASILSFSSTALYPKPDPQGIAEKVDYEFVKYAKGNNILLTPETILIERAIYELKNHRKYSPTNQIENK